MRTPVLIVICTLWLLAAGAGTWALMTYETTPTPAGSAPAQWPTASQVSRQGNRYTLLMFLHPYCPCSRASLEELNRLLVQCKGTLSVHVLFVRPKGVSDDWANTSLGKVAKSIPGVQVGLDPNGDEANRFGAESSGYVVLYSPKGELLFSGGITGSRSHFGENPGEEAIVALANGEPAALHHTHVYGCTLLGNNGNGTNENSL